MTNILKKMELFQNIHEDDIPGMLKCLDCKIKTYHKDEFIFLAGESTPAVGILLAGKAQVIKENIHGDRLIIRKLSAGDMFGESYASMAVKVMPVSVYTLEETQVLLFDLKKIILTCKSACVFHQTLIMNLMKIIARKNAVLSEQMFYLSHKTIRSRMEAYLLDQADKHGSYTFSIPFKRNELAEYLCMDRSAMLRELGKMKEEGILSYNKNTFQINF